MRKLKKAKYFFIFTSIIQILINIIFAFVSLNVSQFIFIVVIVETVKTNENIMIETLLVKSTKKANREEKNNKKNNHLLLFYGFKLFGTILGLSF